ncbi:MAG: NADH-quinone oxidoreductase subunit L [Elusimicrobia bacterium]|nr:NADH-quinone oxidoreductase subunit L [Elusimicrobiota bacterium]
MIENVWLIPVLPLLSAAAILFFGKEGEHSKMPFLGLAVMGWCLLQASCIFAQALLGRFEMPYYHTIPWFQFGVFEMTLGVLIDGPAATLLFVVTLVSFLVQLYSLGYMHGDPRLKRYYAFLSLFTAAMLGLVVSSNLLLLFACWELVGLASYLLIGFWFEKPGPAYASKKAFITTKLGDCGLYVGLLLLFASTGTFDLVMLQARAAAGDLSLEVATAVGLLFLFGAAGKSAQLPLFIWLPDAMEGPTPVSALIHAATMVVAGIYLVARTFFIYNAAPIAMGAVAWVGLLTAFFAATMALTAYDIKRVLAFSTISQLGYMMLGLGVAGYTGALFHLTTHAFFKALLFLGAGSVIHAVHSNDMRDMGELSKKMPVTTATVAVATLAIAGVPGLSGWYSKEEILHSVYGHNPTMWLIAVFTAGLTAFYMSRMFFRTFFGKAGDHHKWDHAHESPWTMTLPLGILAVLSAVAGAILHYTGAFARIVDPALILAAPGTPEASGHATEALSHAAPEGAEALGHAAAAAHEAGHAMLHHPPDFLLPGAAMFVTAAGILGAWKLYGKGDFATAKSLREGFSWAADTLEARYYFDDFFLFLVGLSDRLAAAFFWIDANIIDAVFVDGWAAVARALAWLSDFVDFRFVDGAVDGVGLITGDAGASLRRLVRGQTQEYLMYAALSVAILAVFIITR